MRETVLRPYLRGASPQGNNDDWPGGRDDASGARRKRTVKTVSNC